MTTSRKILTLLSWFCGNLIYLITFIIPKRKNLWVFGSWFGDKYADNSKYLFEHICDNHPEIDAVWTSVNSDTVKMVRGKGYKAFKSYGMKGTWYSMRAGVGIFCHWNSDLNLFATSNMKMVNLWHGTPLKKISYDDEKHSPYNTRLREIIYPIFPFLTKGVSGALITIPAPMMAKTYASAFRMPEENARLTGYARNDIFFKEQVEQFPIKEKIPELRKKNKVGVYLPTHRKKGKFDITKILSDRLDQVNSDFVKAGIVLFVKFHYYDLLYLKKESFDYSNIIFLKDEDINHDIYPLLAMSDFLLTDYSSVYFDYLLTDKPIVFTPFDYQQYLSEEREFYYDYDEITPGPKAYSWDEVSEKIREAFDDPEKYRERRREIRDRFNSFTDGANCERIFDAITKFVSE
jgi:CDP-glycerol glycerophosphotransferase (TagB/SpsB family)